MNPVWNGGGARLVLAVAMLALIVVVLGLAAWTMAENGLSVLDLTSEDVQRFARAWGPWSALASIALMVLHSFVPLPSEFIAVANGMMFGPLWGVVVTWVGAMLGAVVCFALARWLGRPFVSRMMSERRLAQVQNFSTQPVPWLLARLIPVISFNLINYAAGLLGVSWPSFLWTTAIGILPLTIAMVAMGDQLLGAPWWAWALALAGVVLSAMALMRWRRAGG